MTKTVQRSTEKKDRSAVRNKRSSNTKKTNASSKDRPMKDLTTVDWEKFQKKQEEKGDISQKKLSELLGKSESFVSYCKTHGRMYMDDWELLLDILNATDEELALEAEEERAAPPAPAEEPAEEPPVQGHRLEMAAATVSEKQEKTFPAGHVLPMNGEYSELVDLHYELSQVKLLLKRILSDMMDLRKTQLLLKEMEGEGGKHSVRAKAAAILETFLAKDGRCREQDFMKVLAVSGIGIQYA